MRSHGLASFPDPVQQSGGISLTFKSGSGLDPGSQRFRAAQAACRKFAPRRGTDNVMTAAEQQRFLRYSQCMRTHGLPQFPDPNAAAKYQQADAQQRDRYPVPFADEGVKLVFAKIGNIGEQRGRMVVQRTSGHDPAHVRPEPAVTGRVRIAFYVSILVMDAMRGYPEKWAAFQGQRGTDCDEIFEPFMGLETAVREQPVICNANAKAPGNPPQKQRDEKRLPRKHKECCDRAYMECDHEKSGEFPDSVPETFYPA